MKVTKPPRETVSSLNYRDAEGTPTTTASDLVILSEAALISLERNGFVRPVQEPSVHYEREWEVSSQTSRDVRLMIKFLGPDLPKTIPDETAHPSIVPFQRPWTPVYRLIVSAPLVVLDLAWKPNEPLRIMGFSRGDWEEDVVAMARP